MRLMWHDNAWDEYLTWQQLDKKTLKKINNLLKSIERNGYNCIGKPEALSENLADYGALGSTTRIALCSKSAMIRLKS